MPDASMTDFADVEQFAREHSACAGITPSAAPDPGGGGFQLHLVCACGATFRRPVTMDEAKRPLPLPRTARPAPRPPASTNAEIEAPRPAASADAEIEAPRPAASVDAEMERPVSVDAEMEAPRPAVSVDAEMEAPSPPPVSADAEVEATIRAAVEADAAAPAPTAPSPVPAPPPPPVRQLAPAKLDPDTTTRTALAQPTALHRQTPIAGARPAPRTRVAWLILFAIVAFGAAGALYFAGVPEGAGPIPALVASAPPLDQRQRVPLDEIVGSLRQLQAASSPTASLSMYSSRVSSARADVERFIGSTAAGSERTQVRDIMDVHLLAAAAWKARTVGQKDSWEALGLDPRIEVCQSVKRAVELAPPPPNVSRAQARGEAVASAIPLLWECAAAKLAVLDHPPAAQ